MTDDERQIERPAAAQRLTRLWERHNAWFGALISGALIALCYGYVLRLPFFFDDLPHMTWLSGHTMADIWGMSSENIYYRPLAMTVYKLSQLLPKGPQQVAAHAVNPLLHWISAVLVMELMRLLDKPPLTTTRGSGPRWPGPSWPDPCRPDPCQPDPSRPDPGRPDPGRPDPGRPDPGRLDPGRQETAPSPGLTKPLLAGVLFAVFPFFFRAIPWFTALGHVQVVLLATLAAYAAIRAEREGRPAWWALSLLATALAPLAHESGFVCGVIVGGLVIIHYGLRPPGRRHPGHRQSWQRLAWWRLAFVALGVLLNVGVMVARSRLPGTGAFDPDGLNSWFENVMFFLQGLTYPVGPLIGWLVHQRGWHDFTLILSSSAVLGLLLLWLAVRSRKWRWIVGPLWWWAWGSLPAAVTFRYGGLVNSPRFYALASPGIVMLWAGVIVELSCLPRRSWARAHLWRALVVGILTAAIVIPNVSFLLNQRQVHLTLGELYWEIICSADAENAPLGYVNVPAWLAPKKQTYALSKDGMVGLPLYTNVWQLVGVNRETLEVHNVMFVHTLYEPEDAYFGFHGDWLDWEGMRQFALDHRTVWLTQDKGGRFVLHHVGAISRDNAPPGPPLARFERGPEIEAAAVQRAPDGHWTVALTWLATAPVEGNIFVHVVDARSNLVVQADGPALGGMVPLAVWQPGDRVYDVRHLDLPADGGPSADGAPPHTGGPYTVLVGVYDAQGRYPAYVNGVRQPGDAVPVAEMAP